MIIPYKALLCSFEVENFIKNVSTIQEKNLLDIGCGTGHHLVEFRKAGYHVTGLDQSSAMLEEARKQLNSNKEDKIPDELLEAENNRCNGWNGNEEECKNNNCWFYRNSKKCVAHKLKLAEKLKNKSTSIIQKSN
jgi:SAM-dependent methyltransferase